MISVNNVTLAYGKRVLFDEVNLGFTKGNCYGIIGANGAGKSTLMKIIATISQPTEGTLTLDGHNIVKEPNYIRKILGYLPQDFGVYANVNAYEFLEYLAAMKGEGGINLRKRIEAGNPRSLLYIFTRAVFIVSFAICLGMISGGKKLFEILFFAITYCNLNLIPFMDYIGVSKIIQGMQLSC